MLDQIGEFEGISADCKARGNKQNIDKEKFFKFCFGENTRIEDVKFKSNYLKAQLSGAATFEVDKENFFRNCFGDAKVEDIKFADPFLEMSLGRGSQKAVNPGKTEAENFALVGKDDPTKPFKLADKNTENSDSKEDASALNKRKREEVNNEGLVIRGSTSQHIVVPDSQCSEITAGSCDAREPDSSSSLKVECASTEDINRRNVTKAVADITQLLKESCDIIEEVKCFSSDFYKKIQAKLGLLADTLDIITEGGGKDQPTDKMAGGENQDTKSKVVTASGSKEPTLSDKKGKKKAFPGKSGTSSRRTSDMFSTTNRPQRPLSYQSSKPTSELATQTLRRSNSFSKIEKKAVLPSPVSAAAAAKADVKMTDRQAKAFQAAVNRRKK